MKPYSRRVPTGTAVMLLALAGSLIPAGPTAAQERPQPRPMGAVQVFPGPDRGWLGIEFTWESAPGMAEPQLRIAQIVKDSPAERAELGPGDLIRSFGGGSPAPEAVRERAARLRPGDEIVLEVVRSGEDRVRRVTLRADRRPAAMALGQGGEWVAFFPDTIRARFRMNLDSIRVQWEEARGQDIPVLLMQFGEEGRRAMEEARQVMDESRRIQARNIRLFRDRAGTVPMEGTDAGPMVVLLSGQRVVAGAELTPLNPDLARYFGTESGVLAVEVLDDTPAERGGLRGGDVIVRVAGEPVTTVAGVRSALERGYRDPPVSVTVVRDRREMELRFPR